MGGKSKREGDICICMADSFCCAVEANTTSESNYTPIKINLKKEYIDEEGFLGSRVT